MEQIVVGFDGSKSAMDALHWAAEEAEIRGWDVLVLQSWNEPIFGGPSILEAWEDPEAGERQARAELDQVVAIVADDHPKVRFTTELVGERPALALAAASERAPMVVVGARGRGGFSSLLLGSVSQQVAAVAASTVIVVRGRRDGGGDVVVGVDGSEPSRRALAWAAEAARHRQCRLRAVLVWTYLLPRGEHGTEPFRADYTDADARRTLRAIVDDVLGPDPGIDVQLEAVCGLTARALIERSEDAALLVVGPRGTSKHTRFDLGSVSLQVLHHAPCPLAIVRAAEGELR